MVLQSITLPIDTPSIIVTPLTPRARQGKSSLFYISFAQSSLVCALFLTRSLTCVTYARELQHAHFQARSAIKNNLTTIIDWRGEFRCARLWPRRCTVVVVVVVVQQCSSRLRWELVNAETSTRRDYYTITFMRWCAFWSPWLPSFFYVSRQESSDPADYWPTNASWICAGNSRNLDITRAARDAKKKIAPFRRNIPFRGGNSRAFPIPAHEIYVCCNVCRIRHFHSREQPPLHSFRYIKKKM